jgi:serine/threonine protein kinase
MVPRGVQRWTEVTGSQFTHEAEGLGVIRALLPSRDPFRAWSNFEFRDGHGKWHEVDLLVLGQRRLHLVELKYYAGALRGDDHTWLRDGRRAEDSPLKLARRKAQRLASRLHDELITWAQENGTRIPDLRTAVPYVQECVFLHHPDMRCLLPAASRVDLVGPDGRQATSGLPGISSRLLEPALPDQAVTAGRSLIVAELMTRIGAVQRRQRQAGSWIIDEEPLGEGEGWQDWPAFHKVATTTRARIRFQVTPPGASATTRAGVRRVAEHEYRIMSRLAHDGLLRPTDVVDGDLGVGLVYSFDDRFQRLDLWLADHRDEVSAGDKLAIVRQVAEAVGYAHANRVVHRGLTPRAVWVRRRADGSLRVLAGDWQSSGAAARGGLTISSEAGVTGLLGDAGTARPVGPSTAVARAGLADTDRLFAEAFQAPEGVYNPAADRVRLDVFALGALAYYLLAERPPAADRAALRDRLHRDDGLDLAAEIPQVAPEVRALVLAATRSAVSERLADVRAFLEWLAAAETAITTFDENAADPLDAAPGTELGGRYRLERRLGAGSTAVGLLVTDLKVTGGGPDAVRVLKVAVDDAAAARLDAEAEVLAAVRDPRLVRLIDGPVRIGSRVALVLESAGDQTLAEVLRGRERLSLDLLERWGTDLLEALVALDRAGVDHRDIKPANLGVREGRGDRVKHLVLFDFSLSRAGATAVTAGTPPYLDPFLDAAGRGRFDSAAERYSAAVVLFEMATGSVPQFGDGMSDPASLHVEATVEASVFDPAVAEPLTGFFGRALARDAARRFDTAADMLTAWQGAFAPVPKTMPDDADKLAVAATPVTPLARAGLSARALSALEPFGVRTVGDLVAVDPIRLNRMSGVADVTRREVKSRATQWRRQFASAVTGRTAADGTGVESTGAAGAGAALDPVAAADLLVQGAGTARAESRRAVARLLLGLNPRCDPFATQAEIGTALGLSAGRIAQQVGAIQESWAGDEACRTLLDALAEAMSRALAELGGVATVGELSAAIAAALPPAQQVPDETSPARVTAGLLRVAVDQVQALGRADEDATALSSRRRDGRIVLLASDPALLDPAEAIGNMADHLVEHAERAGEPLIPASRAIPRLQGTWTRAADADDLSQPAPSAERLLRLAAALAQKSGLSGSLELHGLDLPLTTALRLALAGAAGGLRITAQEIRDRVKARFPALPPLPDRPRLDDLIRDAGLDLRYDDRHRAYQQPTRVSDTTRLSTRPPTDVGAPGPEYVKGGREGHRLAESASARSFLALGVDADRLDAAVDALVGRLGAVEVDVTRLLIEAMRRQAEAAGLPWETVRAADAAPAGSRDAAGLAVLVQRSLPAIGEAIEDTFAVAPDGTRPVLLTEVAPLARYGHLATLAPWADLATRRGQAIWVLVPQLPGNYGPVIDGRPLPLAAPGQFLRLEPEWITGQAPVPAGDSS